MQDGMIQSFLKYRPFQSYDYSDTVALATVCFMTASDIISQISDEQASKSSYACKVLRTWVIVQIENQQNQIALDVANKAGDGQLEFEDVMKEIRKHAFSSGTAYMKDIENKEKEEERAAKMALTRDNH